jgi:hypothetical protein
VAEESSKVIKVAILSSNSMTKKRYLFVKIAVFGAKK